MAPPDMLAATAVAAAGICFIIYSTLLYFLTACCFWFYVVWKDHCQFHGVTLVSCIFIVYS